MPKLTRKRKHDTSEQEVEIIVPKNKFKAFDEAAQAEEEKLSKILFGGSASFLQSLEEAEQEEIPSCSNVDSGVGETDSDNEQGESPPAWIDEDDDGIEIEVALEIQGRKLPKGGINSRGNQYVNLLKHKFDSVVGKPKWATLDKKRSHDSDSEDEILQTCGFINRTEKNEIPASSLDYKKVTDLNRETYNEGYIQCVEFHPTSSVALIAGKSGVASLYAVDGKKNSKLHSIHFQKYPVMCGKFINNGDKAVLGSHKPYVFDFDLQTAKAMKIFLPHGVTQCKKFVVSPDSKFVAVAGKFGEVHLLAGASKDRIAMLKQDSHVSALSFNPKGDLLYGHSSTGEVTIWDMNMRRVKHKWTDEGCIQGISIAISSSNQFLATGSAQGVVNLYNTRDILTEKLPKPMKSIFNLVTGIGDLKFNSSSELLTLASAATENSVRIFHLGSLTVYNDFPCFGSKLGNITRVNYSPGGGYLALGNRESTVALYRLKHFKSY